MQDEARTSAPPSPRFSRGEGEGEGQRERSRKNLPVVFGGYKSKIVGIDMSLQALLYGRQYGFKHCFPIFQNVNIPKA